MCKILRINGLAMTKSKWKRFRGALECIAMDDKRQGTWTTNQNRQPGESV